MPVPTFSDNQRSEEESKKQRKQVRYVPKTGEQWEVDFERKEILVERGFVTVVKEIKGRVRKQQQEKNKKSE